MQGKWLSPREQCDICKRDISKSEFVDGKTVMGPWALMCLDCFKQYGSGLGTGRGQRYAADGVKKAG